MSAALVKAMSQPGFYPHGPERVSVLQTHISWVFLAGDLVYKVKKPVNFGFLDFSSLEKRRFFCEEEITLNRRLAPDTYLKAVAVHRGRDGTYSLEGPGAVAEWAVVMKRLPDEGMADRMLSEGRLTESVLDLLAGRLAAFHEEAATGGDVDRAGSLSAIGKNHKDNMDVLERYVGSVLTRLQHRFLSVWAERFISGNAALFEERIKKKRIRDCHGDLHLENICVENGVPVVFDCIEFSPALRHGDVAGEIAFLCMDLDYSGAGDLADHFAASYARCATDPGLFGVLAFYKFYRACVRAKVLCLRSDDQSLSSAERKEAWSRACCYLDFAFTYASRFSRPTLIIISGLMGTGKSALARELAATTGSRLIRSDVVRKEILGINPARHVKDPYGKGAYDPETTSRTYEVMLREARLCLENGQSVVLDASFKTAAQRKMAQDLASGAGAEFFAVACQCPETEVKRRLVNRSRIGQDPSDGRVEIFGLQRDDYEEPSEIPARRLIRITTTLTPRRLSQEVITGIQGI
ncbi:MAG: AAA family ATPase [Deltaproteobacteria bacterium]|nr:AAA family ATPase [Deltaproteobacteria bacterium]